MKTIDKRKVIKRTSDQNKLRRKQESRRSLPSEKPQKDDSRVVDDLIQIKKAKTKRYKLLVVLFFALGLCLSFSFVIGMFEMKFPEETSTVVLTSGIGEYEDILEIPQTEQKVAPPPKVQAPNIIVVRDEEIIEDIEIDLDIDMTEDQKIEEQPLVEVEEVMPEEKAEEIFTIVEEQPSPVGGMKAFYEFISSNMKYPARASRSDIEGKVFVGFVVEKDGSISDINVIRGIGAGCDEEAVRVVSLAPKWNPGKQRGMPVRVRMVLPITFKLYKM